MDYGFDQSDLGFGARLDAWVAASLDPAWHTNLVRGTPPWIAFQRSWDQKLYEGGWGGVFWPAEHGGLGATAGQRAIYAQVMAKRGAPEGLAKLGKRLLGPILMTSGTPAQQQRFLGPILRGEEFWCQGFSEPNAGSDLASLITRGRVESDRIVINGQKIWTSHAMYCDWCFVLLRTDPELPRHRGISLVLVETDAPGVDIRPIKQVNGHTEFAEVFFSDVEVPLDRVVGPLHGGWDVAMSVLAYERGVEVAFARAAESERGFNSTLAHLNGKTERDRLIHAVELGRLESDYLGSRINALRLVSTQLTGGDPGVMASVLKLQSSEAWRRGTISQLIMSGSGSLEPALGEGLVADYWNAFSGTIAAGTSEIQRNIIARRILGMA